MPSWDSVKNYVYVITAIAIFYAGYHTRVVLDKAAESDRKTTIIESIPKVITKTQTITKVIHDVAPTDKCVNAPMPAALLDQLR